MKGPGFRLDLDVRRVWECPACGRQRKRAGNVVQLDCHCRGGSPVAMKLLEPRHKTESPFDHVGFAAQKRIDEALHKRTDFDADAPQPPEVTTERSDANGEEISPAEFEDQATTDANAKPDDLS